MLAEAKGIPDPYRRCEAGLGALPVGPMPLSSESIVGNLLCSCILGMQKKSDPASSWCQQGWRWLEQS